MGRRTTIVEIDPGRIYLWQSRLLDDEPAHVPKLPSGEPAGIVDDVPGQTTDSNGHPVWLTVCRREIRTNGTLREAVDEKSACLDCARAVGLT